jgi:parvulin-like peptidyl-prolyl isomerase
MNRRIASIDLRRGTVKIAAMRGLGFAVFGLAGCAPGVPTGPCGAAETAALTIEGQSVSCEAVTRAFFERGYDAFETAFVEATLVERRAAALGIVVTEGEVARAVETALERTLSTRYSGRKADFEAELATSGMSEASWRRARALAVRTDLLAEAILKRTPDEAQLDAAFERSYGRDAVALRVRHLLVSTEAERERAYDESKWRAERTALRDAARQEVAAWTAALGKSAVDPPWTQWRSDHPAAAQDGRLDARAVNALPPATRAQLEAAAPRGHVGTVEEDERFTVYVVEGRWAGAHLQGAHLQFSTLALAEEALRRLKSGVPFAQVAVESSEDTSTKERGGELGAFEIGRFGANAARVLFTLPLERISGVVRGSAGFHVFYLRGREPDPALDGLEVRAFSRSWSYPAERTRRLVGADAGAKARADNFAKRVRDGQSLSALAQQDSDDPSTRARGGLIEGELREALGDAYPEVAHEMRPGEVRVVQSKQGWHVVAVESREKVTRAEVEPALRASLATRPVTGGEVKRYLESLRAQAKVQRHF